MTREYVNALALYEERELSIGGIFALAGFRQQAIGITKLENSASTYSFQNRVWHAINSLVSFSDGPLIGVFILGIVVSFFAIVIIAATLIWVLILDNGLSGWNSLIISIWLIGGFVITSLGVIGLYVGKIFTETKNRPRTIEKKI
jgi:putative glycosyltransferase